MTQPNLPVSQEAHEAAKEWLMGDGGENDMSLENILSLTIAFQRAIAQADAAGYRRAIIAPLFERTVIDALLAAMNAAGITQRALARQMGISEPCISKALRGGSNMTLQKVERIATAIRALAEPKG